MRRLSWAVSWWLGALLISMVAVVLLAITPALADPFFFSTGNPDGRMATGSRPSSDGKIEIESADDFILNSGTILNSASFIGLLPSTLPLTGIVNVDVEIYRVFPKDSQNPPSGKVPTRVNSPSDDAFASRGTASGDLSFTATILTSNFTVANTVLRGINPSPNQTTGGEGSATGNEVQFSVIFTTPIDLPADQYFFVPQVELSGSGDFLWLSAPRPIVPPGTPFSPDLQSWIRNANLDPDWLRVGTDIVGGPAAPTFNATFSLSGVIVPEPSAVVLMGTGVLALFGLGLRRRRRTQ